MRGAEILNDCRSWILIATGTLLVFPNTAGAYVLNPVADTFITDHSGLGGPNSTHANDVLWLVPASGLTYPLIRYDLAAFAGHDVQGNGTLTFPILALHPSRPAVNQTVAIYLSLIAWDEGTVSWNTYGASPGPNFGTDVGGSSLSQVVLPVPPGASFSISVPEATLQAWIDAPATNFGILVHSADNLNQLDMFFRNSEATDGNPVQLSFDTDGGPPRVDVPEPASLALLGAGLLCLVAVRRRAGPRRA